MICSQFLIDLYYIMCAGIDRYTYSQLDLFPLVFRSWRLALVHHSDLEGENTGIDRILLYMTGSKC